ncbi:Rps23 Pro-64 3,4-dihydroxylase Tpa1-like proline 4-hydroxylase [Sphingomonas vulcanisoli]|uniref:Rps23 Pro-64 3,4-dihydroxylase Tpa1-like proline 4-hydroxylase n=1 Tax=Sphingomonas vulcanisoli TaxID=1658060 RepID=A0ABX0TTG9_9SPHN|nr:2OG-Fe(II) oxygenase [Sphingomonas vulcanisoli]NIJ07790.1 Rps23 Pro-64 3,4-dihydroxylase Tpa1-like proline 4-hydroxylase [Sphingomonas vulcanisoli]
MLADCARDIAAFAEWDGEKQFYGSKQKRYCGDIDKLPASVQTVIDEASRPRFIKWLQELTGEKALVPDPYLEGGGIHSIGTGGYLKIHADFNWHEPLQLYRRLNVLLYLNDDWQEDWGGRIELFSDPQREPEVSLLPTMNRMLVFTTDDASFHGHRHALSCPADVRRNSIALYYYSAVTPAKNFAEARTDTDYRAAADETFDKARGLRGKLAALKKVLID